MELTILQNIKMKGFHYWLQKIYFQIEELTMKT